tara:strand:- start:4701 stop:5750 length:1050 start_codon:yes stop_codon:yes gene_type:complete
MNQLKFGYSFSWSGFNEIVAKALKAENNGFDFLWYHDHLLIPSSSTVLESFSVLGGLAVSTKSCKIGQTVVDAYRRHPSVLAHSVLTLNHMSNGRAFLGIGAGQPMNLDPINLEMSQPFMRLKESIQYIKGLLNATKEKPFNFSGKIFTAKNIFLNTEKSNLSPPPIYVGSSGVKTREITGEYADGWIPYVHALKNYEKLLSDVKNGARKSNRNIDELDIVANLPILILENDNENERKKIKRSLGVRLLLESNTLKDLGWNEDIPAGTSQLKMIIDKSTSKILEESADKIPQEICEQIAAIGTVSEIVEILEKYKKMGANQFVIKFLGTPSPNEFSKFNSEVIQIMKSN